MYVHTINVCAYNLNKTVLHTKRALEILPIIVSNLTVGKLRLMETATVSNNEITFTIASWMLFNAIGRKKVIVIS